jgi:hypothetical protein
MYDVGGIITVVVRKAFNKGQDSKITNYGFSKISI